MALDAKLQAAKDLVASNPQQAEQQFRELIFNVAETDADTTKVKEQAISCLSEVYVKLQNAKALSDLLSQLRQFFAVIPKAKTAKIVRGIIDQISKVPGSTQLQVSMRHIQGSKGQ
jgi:26S proteasome regulatory subunit N6